MLRLSPLAACVLVWIGPNAHADPQAISPLNLQGVHFIPNHGQWQDTSVHLGFSSHGLDIAFRESQFTMHLSATSPAPGPHPDNEVAAMRSLPYSTPDVTPPQTLAVAFPGSNLVAPRGIDPQTAEFNYFVGDDASRWAGSVPSYGAVVYHNLYDGIDLIVCGNDVGLLKYEFHIEPGADWSQIRISYDGVDELCLDATGALRIDTQLGTLLDSPPVSWQEGIAQGRRPVRTRFTLLDDHTCGFLIDDILDPEQALVIDPNVEWMIYYGGSGTDTSQGMALDGDQNIYLTGWTDSMDFAGQINSFHGGEYDAFLLKTSQDGQLQWMTYFGGTEGERGFSVAVDSIGSAFIAGPTRSTDFAGANNAFQGGTYDAFLLKADQNGSLEWMAYLGGTGDDGAEAVTVDHRGLILVAGDTDSQDLLGAGNEYHGGLSDIFLATVSSTGELQSSRYIGGAGQDGVRGMIIDESGDALLTGLTDSPDFVGATNAPYGRLDILVARANSFDGVKWMKYYGGRDHDTGYALTPDRTGGTFLAAMTESDDFDGRNNEYFGGERDAAALRLGPSGELIWMLHVGGMGRERGRAIARSLDGGMLFTGGTTSLDFSGSENTHHGGEYDAWIAKVGPEGALRWTRYLGGSADDWGRSINVQPSGRIISGGLTTSSDFEGRTNTYNGFDLTDSFILQVFDETSPQLTVDAECPDGGEMQISWSGATSDGRIALVYSREYGLTRIPEQYPCTGVYLGLGIAQIQLVFEGNAGHDGSRVITTNAPGSACGGLLQLLDITTCRTSNVANVE